MRVLRIADVSRNRAGGVSRFMLKSGDALARRGVEVDELFAEDLVLPAAVGRLRRLAVPWLIAGCVFGRVGGARRPDVVEIHEPLAAPYAAMRRLAPGRLPPCVVMSHGLEERGWIAQRERWRRTGRPTPLKSAISVPLTLVGQARVALRYASRVIVLSTQDAEFLTARRRVPRDRVARVNGAADATLLHAERAVVGPPRVLFVGSWIDRKGIPELCDAWCRLRRAHPDMRLTLAGTALAADRVLQDFSAEWRGGITVVPAVDDEQLLELLSSHDIFVLPSWFEGMPLSMIEAAAAGLACVVTSICGNLDVFRPADPRADGALLIAPHSADALVAAVNALARDPALRAQLGANARRRAAAFTWDRTAAALLDAYHVALGEGTTAPGAELETSVVVASWRRPDDLLRCLAAIDAQTRPAAEVVVVARADDAPTWAALDSVTLTRSRLRPIGVDHPGVVVALNAGLDAASGAIVAVTDDDAAPRPDWLANIHEHLRVRPDVGAVGGRDRLQAHSASANGDRPVVGRLLSYGRVIGNHHRGSGDAREVDVLKGVNVAFRRTALGTIRLDERLRGGGAQAHWELGLCLALTDAGWRLLYDPAVAVDHHPAERFDADQRERPEPGALADEVHNEMYALLRWLPRRRRIAAFAYGMGVGSRRAPGLLVALERWLRDDDRGAVGPRLRTAQRARLDALGTAAQGRRARGEPGERPAVTIVAHDVATPGGMERQLGELCSGLLERGHRVVVIARRCELAPHPRLRWIRVRVPRRPFSLAYPAFLLAGSLVVRRHREGLLHTTGAVVGNRADLSTVHFCHHGYHDAVGVPQTSRHSPGHRINAAVSAWMSRAAERFCFRPSHTRRLVAVSAGVGRELARFVPGASDAVSVIPNGVDRALFAPDPVAGAEVRARLGLAADDLVALFVGGDWERKGLRFAIEGVASAAGWHLLVVGVGDEERHRALADRCDAGDRVHFVGPTTTPAQYYAAADVFLLPTAYEAFPLVALEAAAAGLPLLVGRVSGVEELIEEGRNGWFVERDGAAVAERLRHLGGDPALRREMGLAARASSAHYTWAEVVDAYVTLYATLAPARRSPALVPVPLP